MSSEVESHTAASQTEAASSAEAAVAPADASPSSSTSADAAVAATAPADGAATAAAASSSSAPAAAPAAAAADSSALLPTPLLLREYRLLPTVLPPLPDEIVSYCDASTERSIWRVMQYTNGRGSIHRRALPMLVRFINRIAHMQLLGAQLNGGRVDLYLPVDIGALYTHQRREVDQNRVKFENGTPVATGLTFGMRTAQRWMGEFRRMHPESTLTLEPADFVGLLTSVEYLLSEALASCGNTCESKICYIDVTDVLYGLSNDIELIVLCNYMRQPFEAKMIRSATNEANTVKTVGTPIVREMMGEEYDRYAQQYESLLRSSAPPSCFPRFAPWLQAAAEEFACNEPHLRLLNSACWYNDPAKVTHYAQKFARGEMRSPVSEFFASFGIRPLAFYGRTRRALRNVVGPTVRDQHSFVSFQLFDVDSLLWWPFCLTLRHEKSSFDFDVRFANPPEEKLLSGTLCESAPSSVKAGMKPWQLRAVKWFRSAQLPNFGPQAGSTGASFHRDQAVATSSADSTPSPSAEKDVWKQRRERFELIVAAALKLTEFRQCGAQLFTSNHPLRSRVAFTSAVLECASAAAQLATLPTVLLDLVAEFAPADLPFIKQEQGGQAAEAAVVAAAASTTVFSVNSSAAAAPAAASASSSPASPSSVATAPPPALVALLRPLARDDVLKEPTYLTSSDEDE